MTAALHYAEMGYAVFPCKPGTSRPETKHGFKDASLDPEQIERWWSQNPRANIGLPTAGLVVVDIDGPDNPWPGPERAHELSVGPMATTPSGGSHRIFRQSDGAGWRCTQSVLAPHVDTRANGGYIVVPPSTRPDGDYRWVPGMELEPVDQLPEPPAWLVTLLNETTEKPKRPDKQRSTASASPPPTIPSTANTIPIGQRNATLARLAGAMRRVGMSQSEILAALEKANIERCTPTLPLREVQQIAWSMARYQPDDISVALAENHWEQMCADTEDDDEIPQLQDPGPIPERLLQVPGFINSVIDYTLETAPYPEPVLAFCGALSLQSLLAGRKVCDSADNRTNLYIMGLANSGSGKDHPRKVSQKILFNIGMADCLGNSFASGEGIEDRLFTQPACLFQVDELDGLLLKVTQAKDARHEQIVSILLQMYSSAGSIYVMRAKAGRERNVIDQPSLTLFGTAVPKHFYEAFSPRLMTNGFLARMLIVECKKRGQGQENTTAPVPESILDTARWWSEFRPGAAGNLSDWHPEPQRVEATAEAKDVFREFRRFADDEYSTAEEQGDVIGMAIWARAYEKARRLALIYACSAQHQNPSIDLFGTSWACEFVEHQTRRMLFMAGNHASESDFDARRKRLLEVLAKWHARKGDTWMPFWKINRQLPWSKREHEELRDTLLSQRLIEFNIRQTKGRPGDVYRLTAAGVTAAGQDIAKHPPPKS